MVNKKEAVLAVGVIGIFLFMSIISAANYRFQNTTLQDLLVVSGESGNVTASGWFTGLFSGTFARFATLNVTDVLRVGSTTLFADSTGLNISGVINFNSGWRDGGVTISNGNVFAQALYVFNISSVAVDNLAINGTLSPGADSVFNNTFDLGITGTNEWRYGYFGTDVLIGGESVKKWMYNMSDGSYNASYDAWAYNQTTATYNLYNSAWASTYNASYVPYSGATGNLDMGSYNISMDNNSRSCYGDGCNGEIYYNGSSLIIQVT